MSTIEVITEWEKNNKLFEIGKVKNFDFYAYLRRELVNTIVNLKNNIPVDPLKTAGQTDTGVKLFVKLLKRTEKPPKKNVDLLILCHPRRNKVGEVYESVFTDFLEEEFPNSVTLERMYDNHVHFEPSLTKNICYTDRITLKSYVYRILKSKFCKKEYASVKNEIRSIVEGPFKEIEQILDIELDVKAYVERGVMLYYFYKSRKKDFEKFLDKVNPKLVAEVVPKSVDAMLINEICRGRGIKVVELQHSLLGPIAIYPDGIYEKQAPQYFLSYSDYWSDYQKYAIPKENVISCGSAFFERQVKQYKKDGNVSGKKKILFISAAAYGNELSRVAVELKRACGDKFEIIYKLHPNEFSIWKDSYPELIQEEINVVDSKDVSIYEFFNDAYAQVGVFSTALYEALAFDVKTFILDIPFAAEFRDFCKEGYGTLINNGNELYQYLSDETSVAESLSVAEISEKFWKSDARKNVVEQIERIIELQK